MATKNDKGALQEEALQLGVNIYCGTKADGSVKELSVSALKKAIEARKDELQADHEYEQTEAEKAIESAKEAQRLEAKRKDELRNLVDKQSRSEVVSAPPPDLVEKLGLPKPSKSDFALAKKYGYPVAIPEGKAFRIKISMNCIFGGGLRPAESVMLLTPAEAQHKRDYLQPVQ